MKTRHIQEFGIRSILRCKNKTQLGIDELNKKRIEPSRYFVVRSVIQSETLITFIVVIKCCLHLY